VAQEARIEAATAPEEVLPASRADSAGAAGGVSLRRLAGKELGQIDDAGSLTRTELKDGDGVAIAAVGALAPGVSAAQLYRGAEEQRLGLSLTPCLAPAETSWLVGGGDGVGRSERIVLVNPGFSAVDVRVEVMGERGISGADAADGPGTVVALEPGEREILLVDALAPGVASPVVEVTSTPGPVSAFLGDRWLEGSTDAGIQLNAPVADPATTHVLAGLPDLSAPGSPGDAGSTGDGESVSVRAAVPGGEGAVVDVRALTSDGPMRLRTDVAVLEGGTAQDISVGGLPRDSYALEVTSDRPIVAAAQMRSAENAAGARDLAWAPALPALGALGGTPLPQPGPDGGVGYSLHLASPRGGEAQVLITDTRGEVDSVTLDVPGGHSVVRDLEGAVAVWVVPESGELYASVSAQSRLRPSPSADDVSGDQAQTRAEPVSLLSVLAVPDLPLTRPVLGLVPEVP